MAKQGLLAWALAVGVTLVPATVAWSQAPNIVVVQGDDWGWPYYGFMQRYIAARIAGTCTGGSNPGAPCNANGQCIGGVCASDLVGDDPTHRGKEYKDTQLLVPFYPDPGRPPLDRLITPALDWLAEHGNYWPVAHNSASISQPAFTILMTGLFLRDLVLTPTIPAATVHPVIPQWVPTEYLTLGAGKWQYGTTHVLPDLSPKAPWDREVGQSGNAGEGGRLILRPYAHGVPEEQAVRVSPSSASRTSSPARAAPIPRSASSRRPRMRAPTSRGSPREPSPVAARRSRSTSCSAPSSRI